LWEGYVPESVSREDLDAEWTKREAMWRRKLGRLRLGVEPLEEQLARYRRVTRVLTAIPLALSGFVIILFAFQRRPDVGIVLSAVIFLPIVLGAWLGHASLVSRASGYLRDRAGYLRQRAICSQQVTENKSTPEPE
jgi:hypothetical protein